MPHAAPPGDVGAGVALVFTDIQGSTTLWDALPDAAGTAVATHDALFRDAIEEHGGYEVRTEGDAFKVAFGSPAAAIRWCLDLQQRLLEADWPEPLLGHPLGEEARDGAGTVIWRGLRVRMGGHLGRADGQVHPVTRRIDYFGPMVNETARIANAPAGGQVVVSAFLWENARHEDPELAAEFVCEGLGPHRLRGVAEPMELVQLSSRELCARQFPALRVEAVAQTNLTPARDPFVGRHSDLARLTEALDQAALVSLIGPGGTGKTRLASELGRRSLDRWDAVWFCDCSEAGSLEEMLATMARVLRVPVPDAADDALATLARALSRMDRTLVILDNLEQLGEAATTAVRALVQRSQATLLVTSQHPVRVTGERRIELSPLADDEGVRLLATRVEAIRGRPLSDREQSAARELVAALDGMPLAIELAAARSDMMDLTMMVRRLTQRFRLLAGGGRDAPDRQATLRAAIEWSWNLLTDDERRAASQCAVFAGGFEIDAVEAIVDLGDSDAWPMDVAHALKQKSILHAIEVNNRQRLGMYSTIRTYALDALGEEAEAVHRRLARWYAEQSEDWLFHGLHRHGELDLRVRMMAEIENLELALQQAERPRDSAVLGLCLATTRTMLGPSHEAIRQLEQAERAAEQAADDALLARVITERARQLRLIPEPDRSSEASQRAIEVARRAGDDRALTQALLGDSLMFYYGRRTEAQAAALWREGVEVARRCGDTVWAAVHDAHLAFHRWDPDAVWDAVRTLEAQGAAVHAAWMSGATLQYTIDTNDDLDAIEEGIRAVLATQERLGARLEIAGYRALLAGISAARGDRESTRADLDRAKQVAAPMDAPGTDASLQLAEAYFDAIDARYGDLEARERIRAALDRARTPDASGKPPVEWSQSVALVARWLDYLLRRCDAAD